jgi:hypothetical protein
MKRSIFAVVCVASAVFVGSGVVSRTASRPEKTRTASKTSVPIISQILGVRVGVDTVEMIERIIGPGAPCMGGHPHGGRAWYLKTHHVWVYADGFDYNKKGERVIDDIQLGLRKEDMRYDFNQEEPKPRISMVASENKSVGWLGSILPGMSRQTVVRLTQGLPKPKRSANKLIWSLRGTHETSEGIENAKWNAELTFDKNTVTTVEITLQ